MPTPEEIKEYVDDALSDWCTRNLQIVEPWHQVVEDLSFIAVNAIQKLSKDYCIVPKEMLKDYYDIYKVAYLRNPSFQDRMEYHKGAMQAMEHLFGTELFNEEKV